MKKIIYFLSTFGIAFLITSCSNDNNRHRDLVNYLDSGSHHFTLDSTISDDAAIIEILTEVSKFNEYVKDSMRNDSFKGDAIDILNNAVAFNRYLAGMKVGKRLDTKPISLSVASSYHQKYVTARKNAAQMGSIPNEIKLDSTAAILYTLPKIVAAFKDAYNPNIFTWGDTSWWQQKGFFIFLSNYGSIGHGSSNSDMWQTSSILQLARDVPDTNTATYIRDNWAVIENQLYNFGDLKPPKIRISNFNLAPK